MFSFAPIFTKADRSPAATIHRGPEGPAGRATARRHVSGRQPSARSILSRSPAAGAFSASSIGGAVYGTRAYDLVPTPMPPSRGRKGRAIEPSGGDDE